MATGGAVLAGILLAAVAAAQGPPGDSERGRRLAHDVCGACHAVAPDASASPNAAAPPFQALADDPASTPISLRVLLQTPHRSMPNLILDADETDDVIAYIIGLQ